MSNSVGVFRKVDGAYVTGHLVHAHSFSGVRVAHLLLLLCMYYLTYFMLFIVFICFPCLVFVPGLHPLISTRILVSLITLGTGVKNAAGLKYFGVITSFPFKFWRLWKKILHNLTHIKMQLKEV